MHHNNNGGATWYALRGCLHRGLMKSSQAPVKSVIGYWTHFGTTSDLHQGKNVGVTMKFEDFIRHILRPTLFIDMV